MRGTLGVAIIGLALVVPAVFSEAGQKPVLVRIETEFGVIDVEVDTVHAPITAANFLKYVDGGFYDGGQFHRTVRPDISSKNPIPIQVIQASCKESREKDEFPAIPLERTNATGLSHKNGVISMARGGPDSATSSFFICVGDQSPLDFGGKRNPDGQGFAAFGRVVAGMDVVGRIHRASSDRESLKPPVKILRARRLEDKPGL